MKEKFLDLLAEVCEDDIVKEELDIDLFENGLLDSLGAAELIAGIESLFGVVISPSEVDRKSFNSANNIWAVVEKRR